MAVGELGKLAEQPSLIEVCLDCPAVNAATTSQAMNGLKRPDDHQHHDQRGGDSRNLIDHPNGLAR
jgi:hypothetical protein